MLVEPFDHVLRPEHVGHRTARKVLPAKPQGVKTERVHCSTLPWLGVNCSLEAGENCSIGSVFTLKIDKLAH
ncbi:hypothetical protein ACLOJK_012160 [Asimina triloba]